MDNDALDRLVADYSDQLMAGRRPDRSQFLSQVPSEARPSLERCLKMIEAGMAQVPGRGAALTPGLRLDQYELLREIGRGGMALVWLARDHQLRRPVALKILRPGLALEERHADRFRREGLAIAKLQHPNIVRIFGVGEAHGYHYLAMEYVAGPSFATVLEALPEGREPTAEDLARASGIPSLGASQEAYEPALAALLGPVAEALETAHEAGLVHRDVKPSNILIHSDGRAVIADFGLAKGADDSALSLTGDTLGTPFYMSPEQAYVTGNRVDHRTDIYSFGVVLYEALSGTRPFQGDSFLEVIESIRNTIPPSVRRVAPHCSKDSAAVVRKAMSRDPEERYTTMTKLSEDLLALREGGLVQALQEEGGRLRRLQTQWRMMRSGHPYEYRSVGTFLGLPWVHVISGLRRPGQKKRIARGWFAAGDVAIGGLAFGPIAMGGICFGGIGVGLITWSGISLGLLFAMGGIAAGLFSFGGLAMGYVAFGGIALGYGAIGGLAIGRYSMGGRTVGEHMVNSDGQKDPEAIEWFHQVVPDWAEYLGMSEVMGWFGL